MNKEAIKLYDLVNAHHPEAVFSEILSIISLLDAECIIEAFTAVYFDVIRLFNGQYPGYRASNTQYHNLEHTTMVTLATARLIHGCVRGGFQFKTDNVLLGLLAALFHDSGLIQTLEDRKGTGAKYTIGHEKRSIDFMRKNLGKKNFTRRQMDACAHLIQCTDLNIQLSEIPFCSQELAILGKIVGSADLLAQMADRNYLEKLIYLFREFEEAGIPDFDSEEDLLEKTESFYKNVTQKRLLVEFGNIASHMINHFEHRWNLSRDFYAESIENNINYLKSILAEKKISLLSPQYLRRRKHRKN